MVGWRASDSSIADWWCQISLDHTLGAKSPICLPPEPALLCCSGEVHGQLSILLQPVRGKARSPTVMTPGSALAVARGEREVSPPYPDYLLAKEWQSPTPIGTGSPLPLPPGSFLLCCLGLLSRMLLQVRGGASSPEHYRHQGARTVLHSLWPFMWSPVAALIRDAPCSLVVV